MWYLGDAYSYGRRIAKDLGKAELWYSRAEEAGWTPASYLLGRALESSSQHEAAFKAFSRGSQKDYLPAIYRLAKSYESGLGTSKNFEECVRLLKFATSRGHLFAKRDLAGFYFRGSFGPARVISGLWLLTSLAFDIVRLTCIRAWKRPEYEERILA
ncbi:tetratricopeptide repeat protein [Bradyrhizobium sp. 930_D9_N1_4]|uniref:tetratricopeptide repeat protein n=1 Tax=Bradyrhizobium sp. 930_D9_N1_4 TaxID=3240374 RepID=UPI003F8C0F9E